MTDLDIQIDVPDDDDLDAPVRVLNGSWVPPWLKAAIVFLIGALLLLGIAAYLFGRSNVEPAEVLIPPAVETTPLASAADSPNIAMSLEAVEAWQTFARTGDLAAVESSYDPNGPQFALFRQAEADSPDPDLDFAARNLTETTEGVVTTVSMDLVVSGAEGQEIYPYDFVYLDGRPEVWTVVDRRSPGTAALPPASDMIGSARANWTAFTSALAIGDGQAVEGLVSADSLALAEQLRNEVAGVEAPTEDRLVADEELFQVLVERTRVLTTRETGEVVIGVLDTDQRQALVVGELTSWTQTDPDRIIASLEVAGDPVAVVPFVATAEGWAFDLVGALNMSGGAE